MLGEKSLRVFLYIRVSTQEQAREGYSIGAQEERLRAFAAAKGYTVVKVFTDPGLTGSNMDRPALQEMVRRIEHGDADLVLVYKLDRLSRSQKDTLYLIEEVFLKNKVDFISMNESFDTSTPFGRAMIGILSVFAQLEREQIRERTIMGKEARAKEGKWHGGGGESRLATGYDYKDGNLTVSAYEAGLVRMIFSEYNKGRGVGKIYERAAKDYPGVISTETTIRKILCNPLYIGRIKYKDQTYAGLHEPIIDIDVFQRTQELMKKRTVTTSPFRRQYVLSGLLYCGYCGARMFGRSGGKLKSGEPMKYYVCYSRHGARNHMVKDPDCAKKSERKEKLESLIYDELKKVNVQFVAAHKAQTSVDGNQVQALEKEARQTEKQLTKLVDLYSLDSIPLDIMTAKSKSLKTKLEALLLQIEALQDSSAGSETAELEETLETLAGFDWDGDEVEKKRLLTSKLIDSIEVFDDQLSIRWAF